VRGRSPSERTRVRRLPERGAYERGQIDAILDAGLVCHLGFVHDGHPFVIPTLYGRIGNEVYVHGSSASRMLRTLKGGVDACLTVTLVDGLVLARSIFTLDQLPLGRRLGRAVGSPSGREAARSGLPGAGSCRSLGRGSARRRARAKAT
jgi:hypothetical protein